MDLLSLTKSLQTQTAISKNESASVGFMVSAVGQVESCELKGEDRVYVKYDFTYGKHWEVLQGVDKGISQIGNRSEGPDAAEIVWNFPVEILFKGLNVHGWPRLVVSVFGIDGLGRDVARGYGSMHLPTRPGSYTKTIGLFRPIYASTIRQWIAWVFGTQPEFYDSRFVSRSEGREVTRVESVGTVQVKINILTKGMRSQGYEDGQPIPRHLLESANARRSAKDEERQSHTPAIGNIQSAVSQVLGTRSF